MNRTEIARLLGDEAGLLEHECRTVPRSSLHLPGPGFVDRVFGSSDRSNQVLCNLQRIFDSGRLGGSGYVTILPVDQGVELSAGESFAPNPEYFDPEKVVELALRGGCSAIASTLGLLGAVSRKYAHRIPFCLKLNHNELLTYPNRWDQGMFADVRQAWEMGAAAVGATIYFGSQQSARQIREVGEAFRQAHELGLATILWCYLENAEFDRSWQGGTDYHTAADLTGQANHLGATLGADIIKQRLPETNRGYQGVPGFREMPESVYAHLSGDHPIDRCRYQVVNGYMGRIGLISSGGPSVVIEESGNPERDRRTRWEADLAEAVRTAVINKRAGGMGLICGRKAFQRSMEEGIQLLHAIQDVYLSHEVTIA